MESVSCPNANCESSLWCRPTCGHWRHLPLQTGARRFSGRARPVVHTGLRTHPTLKLSSLLDRWSRLPGGVVPCIGSCRCTVLGTSRIHNSPLLPGRSLPKPIPPPGATPEAHARLFHRGICRLLHRPWDLPNPQQPPSPGPVSPQAYSPTRRYPGSARPALPQGHLPPSAPPDGIAARPYFVPGSLGGRRSRLPMPVLRPRGSPYYARRRSDQARAGCRGRRERLPGRQGRGTTKE